MRLKSLEIKGFKSFADKTIVNFDQAITGIIGPNGCGKSNIVDAIRWVIGEQKISALRSENLEALVFNGSKSRSASGLAEVSLTFDNTRNLLPTEFSTITVSRRFYKNGDSEYRLNDVQCRLKDIHNLFLDTGISNDSYAIIELGMVDDIIKDKDNSRRRMLEQAAGISIYKTRKKEAKQKLDATEQDLSRIDDLLFEINNQLKTIENQAKKAEKYFEIKKDYREISVELAKASLEDFNQTYQNLNEQHSIETDKKTRIEAEIAQEEAVLEQEKLDFVEMEKALHLLQQSFNAVMQEVRTKENEKNLANQKLVYLKEKESQIHAFLDQASTQLKNFSDSIHQKELMKATEDQRLKELVEKVETEKERLEENRSVFDDKRKEVDALRSQHLQMQRLQFDAEKKVAVADTSIHNIQRAQTQLQTEQQHRELQVIQLQKELEDKEIQKEETSDLLIELQEQQEKTKKLILETQSSLEGLRQQLADENRKLDAKKNEYALLKSLVDSMEGYPESMKFLHNNAKWNANAPILSDIIYVNESYRKAVENVLEPYLNYFVVQNWEEGLQAVKLLDENKKGKANFFILSSISDNKLSTQKPDNTFSVLDIIEVDEPYQKLADYLLGNVFVSEGDIDFSRENAGIIIEKDGKFVKGKFELSGGSIGLFEGKKIGRVKNLEKLQDEIILQDAVVIALKAEIKMQHEAVLDYNTHLNDQQIKQTEAALQQINQQVFATKNKIENLQASQLNANQKLEEFEERLLAENDNIAETRSNFSDLNGQLKQLLDSLQIIEQDYKMSEADYNLISSQYNESNLQLTRQHSKINSIDQEISFLNNRLSELDNQIKINKEQLHQISDDLVNSQTLIKTAEKAYADLLEGKAGKEKELNNAEQAYYNFRNGLQEKESSLRLKSKTKEMADQLLSEIKEKINELKLQLTGMKERMNVEFKMDINEILDQERTTEMQLEELQAISDKLRKKLENIGEINPTAVEAFQEMKKRYEFILEQKNDLVMAKESLMQTIQEVEATANRQFLETFNQVRDNFQKVFKALFTEEDTADMILDLPENLAETGIEIVAKPKGKRPSSITQLSGGEKTLTATALLFAIYLIKPAPFCILDEVDAPLDDANVGKFTKMIQQFSENSQFIIVTHNKTTMSTVDVIYGVTMQEAGVSKLVPVDFRSWA